MTEWINEDGTPLELGHIDEEEEYAIADKQPEYAGPQPFSVKQLAKMSPDLLLDHIDEQLITLIDKVETEEDVAMATRMTHLLADNYSYLMQLLSFARIEKRRLARIGKNSDYEDMIDKEAILENALKGIDMQYKALSKSISVFMQMYDATKYQR